ncbi:uncharacterized protein N7459_000229 [Penicillium hispanicum]|uniref:uncharacterized protein n=1 Tax=Penicillium hispanicum TaxID=1080232 RepID=UPI0025420F46|nr:uncharacterized protein N7459_000229 [Penicillium hispanicum]KAJ5594021.1 hypothetical protein N7459_000229 [Penicillium hispanicum]
MSSAVKTLADIPSLSLLYRQGVLRPATSTLQPVQALNDIVSPLRYDITALNVHSIVNAANSSLLGGGGVDGAIHRAAGPQLIEECAQLNGCDVGDAKITLAYNLPCERVIHAVGPIYRREFNRDPKGPERLLRSCYRRSLEIAVSKNVRSIAFSCISTGIYGYPNNQAALVAADEVRKFLSAPENAGKIDRVVFCLFQDEDVRAYDTALP